MSAQSRARAPHGRALIPAVRGLVSLFIAFSLSSSMPFTNRASTAWPRPRPRQVHSLPPSLRGGVADAAIQFRSLTIAAPYQPSEKMNLWIATSATPRRNDAYAGVVLCFRRDYQQAGQPPTLVYWSNGLESICCLLSSRAHRVPPYAAAMQSLHPWKI